MQDLGALGHLPCPLGVTVQVLASSPGRRGSGTEREMGGVCCTSLPTRVQRGEDEEER